MKKGSKKYTNKELKLRTERLNEWIEQYKEHNKIKRDQDIADMLHISQSNLSAMRNGKRDVNNNILVAIHKLDDSYSVEYLAGKTNSRNIIDTLHGHLKVAEQKANIINQLFILNGLTPVKKQLLDYFIHESCYIHNFDEDGNRLSEKIRILPEYLEFEGNAKRAKDIQITFEQIEKTYELIELIFKGNLDL